MANETDIIHEMEKVIDARIESAHARGLAEGEAKGLERAAEIIDAPFGDKPERVFLAKRLRNEAAKIRKEQTND